MATAERKELEKLGRLWVKYTREEAKKDALKSTFVPRSKAFFDSFSYQIELGGVVALYSSWPWMELITEGTKSKYKMGWLTHQRGVDIVPLYQRDGTIVFRRAPLTIGKAWIHPKIAKHTFINRAYERAMEACVEGIFDKVMSNDDRR